MGAVCREKERERERERFPMKHWNGVERASLAPSSAAEFGPVRKAENILSQTRWQEDEDHICAFKSHFCLNGSVANHGSVIQKALWL